MLRLREAMVRLQSHISKWSEHNLSPVPADPKCMVLTIMLHWAQDGPMASQAVGPFFVGLGHLHAFFLPQIVSAKCLTLQMCQHSGSRWGRMPAFLWACWDCWSKASEDVPFSCTLQCKLGMPDGEKAFSEYDQNTQESFFYWKKV